MFFTNKSPKTKTRPPNLLRVSIRISDDVMEGEDTDSFFTLFSKQTKRKNILGDSHYYYYYCLPSISFLMISHLIWKFGITDTAHHVPSSFLGQHIARSR
mmetsp:Transcript_41060/g.98300  ORF Transcript_41060/g.98300 Transcript_41060/m.98300 type:complete len:100 (-) Transcript_41060:1993-2292(-)